MQSMTNLEELGLMRQRMGSPNQQERMIEGKLKSLKGATKYSYQAARIKRLNINKIDPALMNPDTNLGFGNNRMTYDDKIVSVDHSFGYQIGDIFEWLNTKTKWIIYSQDLTELAYFKGRVRRCNFTISWMDEDGNTQSSYAAIKNTLSDEINSSTYNGNFNMDRADHKITVLLPKNEHTIKYFKRYTKFYLNEISEGVCWRVVGIDSISLNNIIQFVAEEYYANKDEDDIKNGIVGGLIVKPTEVENDFITGPDRIKPKQEYEYVFKGAIPKEWICESGKPVIMSIVDNRHVKVKWDKTYKGTFILTNGDINKEIIVESLF